MVILTKERPQTSLSPSVSDGAAPPLVSSPKASLRVTKAAFKWAKKEDDPDLVIVTYETRSSSQDDWSLESKTFDLASSLIPTAIQSHIDSILCASLVALRAESWTSEDLQLNSFEIAYPKPVDPSDPVAPSSDDGPSPTRTTTAHSILSVKLSTSLLDPLCSESAIKLGSHTIKFASDAKNADGYLKSDHSVALQMICQMLGDAIAGKTKKQVEIEPVQLDLGIS